MRLSDYATGMARYNQWMNGKVYAAAAELSDAERKRDRGAFFGSIHGTLNHLYIGDRAWLFRFRGWPLDFKGPRDQPFSDFGRLQEARVRLDGEIIEWAASVRDTFGDSPYSFYSVTYGKHLTLPGWATVVQMFNHQTHHRGQVTTLLTQAGKDVGVTDFPWMPCWTETAGT